MTEVIDNPEQEKALLRIVVARHGEKGEKGQLARWDAIPTQVGQELGSWTKAYSSPVPRAVQTAAKITEGAESFYYPRQKYELSSASLLSEEFSQALKDNYELGFEKVLSDEQASGYAASGLAARLDLFKRMSQRIESQETINLPQITHDLDIAALLRLALLRKKDGDVIRGFGSMEEIGGPFETNESFTLDFANNGGQQIVDVKFGNPVRAQFIGKAFLDLNKVSQLASVYKERVKELYL